MQATLFGAYAANKADLTRECKKEGLPTREAFWDNDDFQTLGLGKHGVDVDKLVEVPRKIFRAWLEDWEEEIRTVNDPVNQARLLEKYGGLSWRDPDEEIMYTACSEKMYFCRARNERGYCVFGLKETYDEDDPNHADDWTPWALNSDLYDMVVEYYQENPNPKIEIVEADASPMSTEL
jgi:hypothetical protein